MRRSPPDVSSIDFSTLRQSFLQHKKSFFSSLFSDPELVQVFNYLPQEVRALRFNGSPDFSLSGTDIICQAFRQLHDQVSTLDFTFNNLTTCKHGDELVQIFKVFPAGLQTLFLYNLENHQADEIACMVATLPKQLRWLSISRGGFQQKTTDELVRIFSALPKGLSSLELKNFSFNANHTGANELTGSDQNNPLQALPRLTYLNLSGSNLGRLPTETIIQILKGLPDTLTALDLSSTQLNRKNSLELVDILSAIPSKVVELSLIGNGLEKRPTDERKQLYQALQSQVALLYLETHKPAIRFTSNLNLLTSSKRLVSNQSKKESAELVLTADEEKHEFGFLIALERSERALWRKNPRAYREDVNEFITHLKQADKPVPKKPDEAANYFMAYAIKLIAQTNNYDKTTESLLDSKYRGDLVSKDNRLNVRGSSALHSLSLWTSLVLLSSLIPDKKIHPTDIKSGNPFADPSHELGYFSLFSARSFYHSGFKKQLNKAAIRDYLMKASTPLPEDEFVDEALEDELSTESHDLTRLEQIQPTTIPLALENPGDAITATRLCQLVKAGRLADIKRYTVSAEAINTLVHHAIWGDFASTVGAYNALMVAAAYRHLDIVQYFIDEKQADCAIQGGRHGEITVLDCAKRSWWFVTAADDALIQYLERVWLKHQQRELANEFVDNVYDDTTGELDEDAPRLQLEMLINLTKPESVCVEVIRAYEQSSNPLVTSTQTILTFLSQAVALQDKEAALELGQRHQLNQPPNDVNSAFDYYVKAAQMGQEEALIPLERLAKKASATQKLALSQLYGLFFQDEDKAAYWRAKSTDLSQPPLTLNP